ncbi:DUF6211 family protein [Streptomyces sp. NPDC059708]|uniref:DUF6211 family protein n=1 Tax=Streptomyces sp. NPDC059708 TaxID=3346916 RepID=UPI003695FAF7
MVDPQPYDLVRLHPASAATAGTTPATTLIIADIVEDQPGTYEVWHLADHPDHHDWAAAVTLDDLAAITRSTATGDVHTWTLSP